LHAAGISLPQCETFNIWAMLLNGPLRREPRDISGLPMVQQAHGRERYRQMVDYLRGNFGDPWGRIHPGWKDSMAGEAPRRYLHSAAKFYVLFPADHLDPPQRGALAPLISLFPPIIFMAETFEKNIAAWGNATAASLRSIVVRVYQSRGEEGTFKPRAGIVLRVPHELRTRRSHDSPR